MIDLLLDVERDLAKRFWAKVDMRGEDECWEWLAATYHHPRPPYGFFHARKKPEASHRSVFKLLCGDIPKGMCVCHSCDNPSCVNPNHLWLGTSTQNHADMMAKGRGPYGSNAPKWAAKLGRPVVEPQLTVEQQLAIIADPRSGYELAPIFNVHRSTIDRVRMRRGLARGKRRKSSGNNLPT